MALVNKVEAQVIDRYEVRADGLISCRLVNTTEIDGIVIAAVPAGRRFFHPGDDVSSAPPGVKELAAQEHTLPRVAVWKRKVADLLPEKTENARAYHAKLVAREDSAENIAHALSKVVDCKAEEDAAEAAALAAEAAAE